MYKNTNEFLPAIVAGLDLRAEDKFYGICGSGDQAFAALEFVKKVVAVDKDEDQIIYAEKRKNNLSAGNFDFECNSAVRYYFGLEGRLEKIGAKLDWLTFLKVDDFLDKLDLDRFNKIYMSNLLYWTLTKQSGVNAYMQKLANKIPEGALVYISSAGNILGQFVEFKFPWDEKWPKNMIKVGELSAVANRLEKEEGSRWDPVVYRKINK